MTALTKNLDHSRAAYKFAINSIPTQESAFPIDCSGFRFEKPSQLHSMVIEFGWAFFCRYEACLEAYIKCKGIKLSKKLSLTEWFEKQKIVIPDSFKTGLSLYRKVRNKLHHEDGASLDGSEEGEIHLLPEHMENFYNLFVWCGENIEAWANKAAQSGRS
jgi:hypothetical protein